jgi:hypothetical protein
LDKVSLTVVSEGRPGPDSLVSGVRVLTPDGRTAFSQALNHALFDTPADYLVVSKGELWQEAAAIEALLQEFRRDLYLGLIMLRTAEGKPTGFILPARFLLAAGLMRFDNADLAVEDLGYRLRDLGLGVMDRRSEAPVLTTAFCSQEISPKDKRRFEGEWTLDPEARIRARQLLKLVVDQAWKMRPLGGPGPGEKGRGNLPDLFSGTQVPGRVLLTTGQGLGSRAAFAVYLRGRP